MNEGIMKFVEGFTKNQLIGYFLLLWAATWFFSAISGFIWLTGSYAELADFVIDIPYNLVKLGLAAVLAMLGLKTLKEKEE